MPAHPIHTERKPQDFYETPYWVTRVLLDDYLLINKHLTILEPCAGAGAISRQIKKYYPDSFVSQFEIRGEEEEKLKEFGDIRIGDFLTKQLSYYSHVITNPPFSIAKEFLEHTFEQLPSSEVIMLLPLSILGSDERHEFWKKNPPDTLWILSDRPSFINNKTDSSVYAWFGWNTQITGVRFLKNTYKTKYNKNVTEEYYDRQFHFDLEAPNFREIYQKYIKNKPTEDLYREISNSLSQRGYNIV
ncbi:MAG: hypothetical protein ACTSW1_07520 [Candidatus Hodarchaeales archaeon]